MFSPSPPSSNIDGKVDVVVVAVVVLDVDVLLSSGAWFEQPLYDIYMYPISFPLPPFGQPPVGYATICLT